MNSRLAYFPRILDYELDELLSGLAALSIEGPKAVGKTATAMQRARTVHRLDDPAEADLARADPQRLTTGDPPILIDEWQRVPAVWDAVRRAVDEDPSPNRFLITGSASPTGPPTHSGAGRIVRLRMRPLSLAERGLATPTVSLAELLSGRMADLGGESAVDLSGYADEIVSSGFPAIRLLPARARRAQLQSYIARIVDRDFEEQGHPVRRPDSLRRWLTAFGAATSTTATHETIRAAATGSESDKPARSTANMYRDTLEKLWILDSVPAWSATRNFIARLAQPDKHHLTDPALVTTLLGLDAGALLGGESGGVRIPRDGTLLGHLFESLVTQSVQVYAQRAEASVRHLRTKAGRQDIDLIIERADGRVIALEVKLGRTVTDDDVKHLLWLRKSIGSDLLDAIVVTTGTHAYRRQDGIGVVPASLLGP